MDITIRISESEGPSLPDRQRLLAEVAQAKRQAGGNRELDLLRAIALQARAVTKTSKSNPVERDDAIKRLVGPIAEYEKEIGDALWGTA